MHKYSKYLARFAIAFSPTIALALALTLGLAKDATGGLSTATGILQGFFLAPFIVWMWIDFRRNPAKYVVPGWLTTGIDLLLIASIVAAVAYPFFAS